MDKMILMVRGHEMWLEAPVIKADSAEMTLAYGHNLKTDGRPDRDRLSTVMYGKGRTLIPRIKPAADQYVLKIKVGSPGVYAAFVDMSPLVLTHTKEKNYQRGPKNMYKDAFYAGAFHQMAKTIVRAGERVRYRPSHVHGMLDIVPDRAVLKTGEAVRLTVLYEGKPLPGIDVKAISKKLGCETAVVRTDGEGVALVPVPAEGLWMFLVRHADPAKGVPELYDEAVYVTSLTLEAKRN